MDAVRDKMEKRADEIRRLATVTNTSVEDLGALALLAAEIVVARSTAAVGDGIQSVFVARVLADNVTSVMEARIAVLFADKARKEKTSEQG